jgi:anti-sigma B factor antagonist
MTETLSLQSRNAARAGQRIYALAGPLSILTVPDFLKIVKADPAPVLILDFSDVNFVDSAGVGALLQIYASRAKNQRQLGLANVGRRTLAVLEITRVQSLFRIFSSVAEAEEELA